MKVVHIGPNSFLKKKLWKEYQTNKFHSDVTLVCDDGTTQANRVFLAAQSKVQHVYIPNWYIYTFFKESCIYSIGLSSIAQCTDQPILYINR